MFEFPDEVRLILLKSLFDACLECQVTVVSKLNFKKRVCKKYWFSRKKNFSPAGFKPATSWMQVSCTNHWAISAAVFDGMLLEFSPPLCLQPAAERNLITAFTRSDNLEVGGWWIYYTKQLIWQCRQSQVSYRRDRQTDGRIAFQLYI